LRSLTRNSATSFTNTAKKPNGCNAHGAQ